MRREGWAKSQTGLYVWPQHSARPRRILLTDDLLSACQMAAGDLLCGRESALQPRVIARIRVGTGQMHTLYDPNPGYSNLALGRVERLHWTNANGLETYGDLVYPTDYEPGRRYPLIVTTYTSRGFLRGATGDEYPIQLFANHGYAVLSFARPLDVGVNLAGVPDVMTSSRIAYRDWADRRSVQSSIELGLDLLDEKGLVDRARIGITGLSDGASTVQFALLNSQLFAAAAISNCCTEPETALAGIGVQNADYFRKLGFPRLDDPLAAFWKPMSLVANAQRMRTPLLMQLGSAEFRMALSSYSALRDYGQPVDMYVFPQEGHVKLQPAHRLAVYRRNLAWFDFWLKGERDKDLVDPADLSRWEAWRSLITTSVPGEGSGG
jgi:dipeptidyl aminopeptidase/acylaminoacyl peptidase